MNAQPTQPRFVSLRWRLLLPIFIALLVAAMGGAYVLATNMNGGLQVSQTNMLLGSSRAIMERLAGLYDRHLTEAQRAAFTVGVPEAIAAGKVSTLQPTLESLASLADLDSIIVTDAKGIEVVGLLRVDARGQYAVNTGTDLSREAVTRTVLDNGIVGATALFRAPEGYMLYTAVPVRQKDQIVGTVLVGTRLERILADLRDSTVQNLALYDRDAALIQTTFSADTSALASLALPANTFHEALMTSNRTTVQGVVIDGHVYQGAYLPFSFGPNTLGILAAVAPNNIPFADGIGRQLTALVMASVAALVVIAAFVTVNMLVLGRVSAITTVAKSLAAGQSGVRTAMKPTDEIGALGQALDRYADYAQERQDVLRLTLRRQRRETEHLLAVLESLPDGIVVQDMDGQVMMMNDRARSLLGSQIIFHEMGLQELTAAVTDTLGPALAPGLYAMGDPQRVELEGKMLSAQAAAVLNIAQQRVGTVIVLRDITEEVRRERARDELLRRIENDVQYPLAESARVRISQPPLTAFARELTHHAVALQKLVVEMRELSAPDTAGVRDGQRPLYLETLVWTVANEWRQVATAANLTLEVMIARKGLYILGDERRLRWAIGNIMDNAVKYTPPGGRVTLEIQGESTGRANLRVRDSGAGITPEELPHVFTRFYRGHPVTSAGRAVVVPGTGQGLSIAKQIIEAHGGAIYIKSKPGVGTAVYFALPLTAAVGLELPMLQMDMEGETVPLRQDELS